MYGASEDSRTIVIERSAVGGQAGSSSRIKNYLGFPDGISGWELADRARRQAQRLGAEIVVAEEGVVSNHEDVLGVSWLASGTKIVSRATICATGIDYTRLGIADKDKFLNHGLFYGAGSSEVSLCTGHVFVIGGGNSAGQAALNFSAHTVKATMLVRGETLSETLSSYLVEPIRQCKNIEVCSCTSLTKLEGGEALEGTEYKSSENGRTTAAATRWVFVCIGGTPRTEWAKSKLVQTDQSGYLLTGDDLSLEDLPSQYWNSGRRPLFMETSRPGMFAAGDIRHNSVKRCATAVGDGAAAVSMVHRFLAF